MKAHKARTGRGETKVVSGLSRLEIGSHIALIVGTNFGNFIHVQVYFKDIVNIESLIVIVVETRVDTITCFVGILWIANALLFLGGSGTFKCQRVTRVEGESQEKECKGFHGDGRWRCLQKL